MVFSKYLKIATNKAINLSYQSFIFFLLLPKSLKNANIKSCMDKRVVQDFYNLDSSVKHLYETLKVWYSNLYFSVYLFYVYCF